MTKRTLVIPCAAFALAGAAAALIAAQASAVHAQPPAGGRAYEYVVILEGANGQRGVDQLNRAGAGGWDLASVVCMTTATRDCFYYMKRPK